MESAIKQDSKNAPPLKVLLAAPRGFCAGVERAIEIVEKALSLYGAPIYVRHEIVHNRWVVEDLHAKGVVFVKEIDEIPDGGITIFSAHGISEKVEKSAQLRDLPIIDATCPLVTKVHNQAIRYEREDYEIVLIGHAGHPEVEGTSGRVKKVHLVERSEDVATLDIAANAKLAYVTQTTLSVDDTKDIIAALKERFAQIEGPDIHDICYATQNRQHAVREMAQHVSLLLVVGSKNSSNSNRLRDLALEQNIQAYLIDGPEDINPDWLKNVDVMGITAGASAPESLVQGVLRYLEMQRPVTLEQFTVVKEAVSFNLPPQVRHRPFTEKLRQA
jgi:4-hydroxy-3-methylbut-2-enyl diphosphate reductase